MSLSNQGDSDPRLLVVAEDLLARAGLTALLAERGWGDLAHTDGAGLAAAIERFAPDILALDLGWRGEALLERLAQADLQLPVLALAAENESGEVIRGFMRALARCPGYALLPRDGDPDAIVGALQALDHGLIVLDPAFNALPIAAPPRPSAADAASLTERENQVLQLLARGLTNRAIAHKLGITEHTVKFHVNAIMGKLGAQSRTEAVVRASKSGLIVL